MNHSRIFSSLHAAYFSGLIALLLVNLATAQTTPADKAQALLQEVKARELDRQRAAKMRDVERINEDIEKGKKEVEDLQQSLGPMGAAVTDSTNRLAQLNARQRQISKMMEVLKLQIDSETAKLEGLKMLSDAQAKGVAAMSRGVEETQVRGEIEKAKLAPGSTAPAGDGGTSPSVDLERKLDRAERAASTAESQAREAMAAATTQMQNASTADEKMRARATELGIPVQTDPAPSQDSIEPLQEIDPLQPGGNVPLALPVKK